jgi:signal transduction histidine kinase
MQRQPLGERPADAPRPWRTLHYIADAMTERARTWRCATSSLLSILLSWWAHEAAAQQDPETIARSRGDSAQVLVITGSDPYLPGFVIVDRAMRTAVAQRYPRPVVWLYESIDTARMGGQPGPELAELYSRKYRNTRIDAVVLVTEPAVEFYLSHRDRLWPKVPAIVHSITPEFARRIGVVPGVSGLTTDVDVGSTLRIAFGLQPSAGRIVVIGGVAPFDELVLSTAREALKAYSDRVPVEFLVGPSPTTIARRLATETKDTVVLYTTLFRDAEGSVYVPRDVLEMLGKASAVPIYGPFDSMIGYGLTAGAMEPFTERGERVGTLIGAALEQPAALPPIAPPPASRCIADGRQLARFGLPARLLPPDCEVRFVEPSFLGRYWWQMLLVAAVIAAQALLIAQLLLQRRQRRLAEARLQKNRSQLLHASRLAVAGELTASIAHEINQPLGAILSNAEAAEMMLRADRADRGELLQILGDIRNDDLRASAVIKRLRALLARHEVELGPCDLNQVAQDAVAILRGEARRRGVAIDFVTEARDATVRGDPVQLQQVIIALGLNAFDASATMPDGERRVRIRTLDMPDGVQVSVRDFGVGITPADLPRVFDSFFTTKRQGMGLGLSIARTIIEAHGGTIEAAARQEGAEFRFTLPAVRADHDSTPDTKHAP